MNAGVTTDRNIVEYRERWKNQLKMLRSGETYREHPEDLKKQMVKAEKSKNRGFVQKFILRGFHFIKRRIIREEKL